MTEQPKPVSPNTELPAEEADINERIAGFNAALLPLLGKYELGLAAMPKITGDGRIVADPIIVSVRGRKDLQDQQKEGAQTAPPAPASDAAGLSKVE